MRALLCLLSVCVQAVNGHHSLAAEFDVDRPVTIAGTIAKIEWINPHAWIYLDVDGASGLERWSFEIGSPTDLIRRGWSRTDLKTGSRVSIEGILARKLPRTANARSITLANGKRVFNGRAPEATSP